MNILREQRNFTSFLAKTCSCHHKAIFALFSAVTHPWLPYPPMAPLRKGRLCFEALPRDVIFYRYLRRILPPTESPNYTVSLYPNRLFRVRDEASTNIARAILLYVSANNPYPFPNSW